MVSNGGNALQVSRGDARELGLRRQANLAVCRLMDQPKTGEHFGRHIHLPARNVMFIAVEGGGKSPPRMLCLCRQISVVATKNAEIFND